jgi:hypothetical protein
MRRTVDLARQEFNATHRPRIRIKHVWLKEQLAVGKEAVVDILYTNVGDAKAIVDNFGVGFTIGPAGQPIPGRLALDKISMPSEVGLGITIDLQGVRTGPSFDTGTINSINLGATWLYCFGFVEYYDGGPKETQRVKRTAFCRRYKPGLGGAPGRFWPLEEPDTDYEYED